MAEYQKICVVCCSQFIAKQKNTMYCSKKCGQTAYRTGVAKVKTGSTQKITDEQLSQSIDEGLSRQEIADKYGMHVESIARRMQRIGKYAGGLEGGDQLRGLRQNWGKKTENLKNEKVFGDCWHYIESQDALVKEKQPGFMYMESRRGLIRLKCKECLFVFERYRTNVSRDKIKCPSCEEKRKQKEQLQNERIKLMRFFVALKVYKTPKICAECGKEYFSKSNYSKYCSQRCKKGNSTNIRARCRHYGTYYDPAVKRRLVFERDHYICQICGMATDPDDKSWNGSFGPYSPTVDHIMALANGGTHTWDNVQCAHAKCNSWKRDLLTV